MPIYAYRCSSCGHAKDVLQKISDPKLTVCPACNTATFEKQLTSAGFQLKGAGWYVTDFRDGKKDGANSGVGEAKTTAAPSDAAASAKTDAPASASSPAPQAATSSSSSPSASPAPAVSAPAPAPAPAKAPAP